MLFVIWYLENRGGSGEGLGGFEGAAVVAHLHGVDER